MMHEAQRHYDTLPAKKLLYGYQSFYQRENKKSAEQQYNTMIDEDVDITAKEMANSDFGRRVKKLCQI
jgi:hypothetical protein